MNDKIVIKGAKEHNLKNISLEIPRGQISSNNRAFRFGKIFTGI